MIIAISNFRSTIVKKIKNIQRVKAIYLMIAALVSPVLIMGCSVADGTDLAPRDEVLQTLRDQGFVFNKFIISTVYGENKNQVIVSGQLAQKTPDNTHVTNGVKLTQFREVVTENVNGAWKITSATSIERDQFTSRERWKN